MVDQVLEPSDQPIVYILYQKSTIIPKAFTQRERQGKNTITCVLLKASETTVWVHHHTASWFTFEILRDPKVYGV